MGIIVMKIRSKIRERRLDRERRFKGVKDIPVSFINNGYRCYIL